MKKVLIGLVIFILMGIFSGCSESSSSSEPITMQELEVPEGFTFETTQLINVIAYGPVNRTLTVTKETGEVIHKGLLTASDGFDQNIVVATSVTSLKFTYNGETITQSITPDQGCIHLYFSNENRDRDLRTDSDGDGVVDDEDDFPSDSTLAYRLQYPPQPPDSSRCCYVEYSTLAFEDLWPNEGDYDFNDVIINYQIEEWLSCRCEIRTITFNLYYSVDGAGYDDGFYIKIPFDETGIAEINYPDTFPQREGFDYYYDTENGADGNLVLRFFERGHSYMPNDPTEFHNTEEGSGFTDPMQFLLTVYLDDSEEYTNRPIHHLPPYNPFLVINQDVTREVHFANYPPTGNANIAYFGTGDDTTDLVEERYYLTADDLPWGMMIPETFDNPLERISILDAYPQFADWVTSGGAQNADWYDYPVEENVFDFVEPFDDMVNGW